MYKREFEKKQKEEQEATARAFHEFIKTFQDVSGPPNKLFVRSGILHGAKEEESTSKGKLYNPSYAVKSNPNTMKHALECARMLKDPKPERGLNKEKPKSNLEQLKEELRLRHLERNEKKTLLLSSAPTVSSAELSSTNLFVANISPKATEQDLIQIFGAFGPLASVKIMWPKSDDKARTNCGFVAYMSRKDGERALQELKNHEEMRVGWGKPVELPNHPVYIPPELLKLLLPPPYTGLPFNAQPLKLPFEHPKNFEEMQQLLYNSVVKVTIPLDKKLLMLIHRTIEFVITEGPLFEAIIMNREINNPAFQFLFDNKLPAHVYYRWKLYSILKGESPTSWSSEKFRMFQGGSVWIPPMLPDYSKGMPDNLVTKNCEKSATLLSEAQSNRLVQYIQNLVPTKTKIGESMVFCVNHHEASSEIAALLTESLMNPATCPLKKVARLYLISDILRNASRKASNTYRDEFEKQIFKIFEQLKDTYSSLLAADQGAFKTKIFTVLKAWNLWQMFPNESLLKLANMFDGTDKELVEEDDLYEPLDGRNLIKRLQSDASDISINLMSSKPVATIAPKTPLALKKNEETPTQLPPGFVPSKWEQIDPEELEAQAMSTKKFHDIEMLVNHHQKIKAKPIKPKVLHRAKLRELEVEVMKYQDELESGKRKLKRNLTLEEQVNGYREYLLSKGEQLSDSEESSSSPEERKKRKFGKKRRSNKRKD